MRQAGVDGDEVRCRDQLLLAGVEVCEAEAAFEDVQDGPVAGCEGVVGLEGVG